MDECADSDGDVDADRVTDGTLSLPADDAGAITSEPVPSDSGSSAPFVGLKTMMDLEAAVTSWVKLAGPFALFAAGFSCLIDH